MIFFKDLKSYLSDHGALLALLLVLLMLSYCWDLWGAFGADFSPGPQHGCAWPCSPVMKRLDSGITMGIRLGIPL